MNHCFVKFKRPLAYADLEYIEIKVSLQKTKDKKENSQATLLGTPVQSNATQNCTTDIKSTFISFLITFIISQFAVEWVVEQYWSALY